MKIQPIKISKEALISIAITAIYTVAAILLFSALASMGKPAWWKGIFDPAWFTSPNKHQIWAHIYWLQILHTLTVIIAALLSAIIFLRLNPTPTKKAFYIIVFTATTIMIGTHVYNAHIEDLYEYFIDTIWQNRNVLSAIYLLDHIKIIAAPPLFIWIYNRRIKAKLLKKN